MKIKFFLRGLGIGILMTTLVLCVFYRKQNSEGSIVERARELGMEFPEKTAGPLINPSASPEAVPSGATADPAVQSVATAIPVQTDAPAPAAATTQGPAVQPAQKPPAKTDARKTHMFTVRGGLLSSSVAREMKAAGVIEDDDALDEYLEKNGLARKVRAGKYKIPVGASYEEIAKIITRQD